MQTVVQDYPLDGRVVAKVCRDISRQFGVRIRDAVVAATNVESIMVMATLPDGSSRRFRKVGGKFVDEITIGD